MQVIRQASKGRSGLRLWSRALGTKANRKTPPRQPLTGVTLWGCLVGLMLTAGVGWAHTGGEPLPMPTCSGLPETIASPVALVAANVATYDNPTAGTQTTRLDLTTTAGDSETDNAGDSAFRYGRITVPALTAGELMVTIDATSGTGGSAVTLPTNAILCQRDSTQVLATGSTSYAGSHADADAAGAAARTAATEAARTARLLEDDADRATVSEVSTAVRDAIDALVAAERALTALDEVEGQSVAQSNFDAISDEITDLRALGTISAANAYEAGTATALDEAAAALRSNAATHLEAAFEDSHQGVDMTAYIDSGVEEYIVVLATDHTDLPDVEVRFKGLMGTGEVARLIGDTTETETFTFTTNVEGLFMADTSGRSVSGTLERSGSEVGVDTATGKVGITAPLTTAGTYTLTVTDMGGSGDGVVTLSAWFRSSESLTLGSDEEDEEITEGISNYYHFSGQNAILTIGAIADRATTNRMGADTTGILYSKNGRISGEDVERVGGFEIMVPIIATDQYILEVKGDTSRIAGFFTIESQADDATPVAELPSLMQSGTIGERPEYFVFDIPTDGGWLQVKITSPLDENLDADAVLSGPDGSPVMDATGTGHPNFAAMVTMGQHILRVTGRGQAVGSYTLALNFIESLAFQAQQPVIVPADNTALVAACEQEIMDGNYMPTGYVPTTGSEFETACRDADFVRTVRVGGGGGGGGGGRTRTVEIPPSEAECRRYTQVETDATGNLENPSPGGYRSGVSVISGWACSANDVTIAIYDSDGERVANMKAAYGTSRQDVLRAGRCDHNDELVGFGLTYNFNLLPAGEYTIRALADNQRIGEQSFTIVHVSDDPFAEDLMGMCTAEDFPEAGYETELMWEESIQNFVIHEVMDVSMAQ